MANGHGGARPGAGRKSKQTADYQAAMRGVFEERVSPERWAAIVDRAVDQALEGDPNARTWLTPWVVGAVPKEVATATDDQGRTVIVIE